MPAHAAPPASATTPVHVRIANLSSALQGARDSLVFELLGRATARCAPLVLDTTRSGEAIDIRLHWPTLGCIPSSAVAFTIPVDVGAITGKALPRGRVYRVSVHDEQGGLLAFRLFETDLADAGFSPENGFWWPQVDPAAPAGTVSGSGVGIESQGPLLAVSLFGFDDTGATRWYFGSTHRNGRVISVPLLQLQHGDSTFAPIGKQPTAQPGPRIDIEFLSPARARAWLVQRVNGWDLSVREIALARSPFANTDAPAARMSGRWILVGNDESAPRQFDFSPQHDAIGMGLRVVDSGVDAELNCRLEPGTMQSDLCTLSIAGMPSANFDRIGLDRLIGRASNGTTVQLLRVPQVQ